MTRDLTLQQADIEWDENGQPLSSQYRDVYFSPTSGIDESRYVFLQHNHLPERWEKLPSNAPGSFTIAETGFGTGLNFLAAAELWLNSAPQNWRLHFVSVEKFPLSRSDFKQAQALWPQLNKLARELQANYPPQIPGFHHLQLCGGRIQLTLLFGEAANMLEQLKGSDHPLWRRNGNPIVDAWFLDGFAPARNPDMWSERLFEAVADLSGKGTTIATFTAASIVQRGLKAAGFEIEKPPGFGCKREMVRAYMHTTPVIEQSTELLQPASYNAVIAAPWYLNTNSRSTSQHAVIIGGGIAGCTAAHSLAIRGWQVTLIERHESLANEASGNPQGIIYPKFSKQDSPLSRYGLHCLSYASQFYKPFWQQGGYGEQCGVLLLPETDKQVAEFPLIAKRFAASPELVQLTDQARLAEISGLSIESQLGLHCPELGWVIPPRICNALVDHPNISVITAEVQHLLRNKQNNHWLLLDNNGKQIAAAGTAILASSHQVAQFEQTCHLPLKRIRGQITQVATDNPALKTVLCGTGYIVPAHNGSYTLGATYNLKDDCREVRDSDHQTNLEKLTATDRAIKDILPEETESLKGRVGFRCTTPDYLPIVGPAPKLEAMQERFALLKKNARAHIPLPGDYYQGLYISCGYGSRGLSYAPLAAELLAAQICGEVVPVELDLITALNPARFLIRDLKRG